MENFAELMQRLLEIQSGALRPTSNLLQFGGGPYI